MRNRIVCTAVAAAGLIALTTGSASAADPAARDASQSCGSVKLTGELPAPPAGMAVQQEVTMGEDCELVTGPVKFVPLAKSKAPAGIVAAAQAGTTKQLRSWNEMFDCCNIRMTGLYTDSTWTSDGSKVTTAATTPRQEWNREPWNAGWNLKSATNKNDCVTDCTVVNSEAHADFTYKGIFDTSGNTYANTHHSYIQLKADGTSSCRFEVQNRNTFIGWNWQRGCA
ncbi:hypothetical protein [Streptomyces sp. NPDC050504]|uniref:hypothetical protein n=1 Tax=Streptomyces sp. NPDC050504 TaxID=3365618 RepID=UPI00379E7F62